MDGSRRISGDQLIYTRYRSRNRDYKWMVLEEYLGYNIPGTGLE